MSQPFRGGELPGDSQRMLKIWRRLISLKSDQEGSVSLTTVFFVVIFAMLLGLLMNIGRHADREIIMQNGSDAGAYTGGVVLSRGMNTLAYTNHLEADVFALVAYLREVQSGAAVRRAIERLQRVGPAQRQEAELERRVIEVFEQLNMAIAARVLSTFETILEQREFPEFQREFAASIPQMAMDAANEIVQRHAPANAGLAGDDGAGTYVIYRADSVPLDQTDESVQFTLPVIDPNLAGVEVTVIERAVRERSRLAGRYLRELNGRMLAEVGAQTRLSRFARLWQTETNRQLQELLAEYPDSNLPFQIRQRNPDMDSNQQLEIDTMFVGVMYWGEMPERLPGLFENPMDADDVMYSQIRLFVPRGRLVFDPTLPFDEQIFRERIPRYRNLLNQNWTTRLVPGTLENIPEVLQQSPDNSTITPLNLGGLHVEEFRQLNTH